VHAFLKRFHISTLMAGWPSNSSSHHRTAQVSQWRKIWPNIGLSKIPRRSGDVFPRRLNQIPRIDYWGLSTRNKSWWTTSFTSQGPTDVRICSQPLGWEPRLAQLLGASMRKGGTLLTSWIFGTFLNWREPPFCGISTTSHHVHLSLSLSL
jgi:hypothetical protein